MNIQNWPDSCSELHLIYGSNSIHRDISTTLIDSIGDLETTLTANETSLRDIEPHSSIADSRSTHQQERTINFDYSAEGIREPVKYCQQHLFGLKHWPRIADN